MGTPPRPGARRVILMLASSLSLGACQVTYTLDSAIPRDQVTFDSTLLGTWESPDSVGGWAIKGSVPFVLISKDDRRYLIELTNDDGERSSLSGILGKLGEATVLEIWPATESEIEDWPLGRIQLVLELAPDSVVMRAFQYDSIRSALDFGRLDVPHLRVREGWDERLILVAPTEDLARALTAQLGRPGALSEPGIWHRADGR